MHRINFLIIVIIILQITIGCKSDKKAFQECVNFVEKQLSNKKIDFVVIIPNQGCAGCISYMEDFYIHNNENPSIAFVFTNITSLKILKMKIKIKNEEIKYKKENYIILARMSDELYRLQHNLRYVLLKIKYCLNDREYDKCKNLVDSYVDKLRKFKILINTDNPYFDYLINQELNDLDLRGIDINISVSISNSDYYLNKNYVNYVISLMEYLKDKVKKLTINIYEVNNNNVIEIILNELDDFFIQKNIQDLILLIDAEYKISKQNEMLIFKSIQQIHN